VKVPPAVTSVYSMNSTVANVGSVLTSTATERV
jgi:hypothetical protein